MKLALDTNILIYSVDAKDSAKQTAAIDLIARAARQTAVLPQQALLEFLSVATNKVGVPLQSASALIQSWSAVFEIVGPGPNAVEGTMRLMSRHKLSVWDAHLLAVCSDEDVNVILTEDLQDGAQYNNVRVINPFAPSNAKIVREILSP